MRSLAAMGGLYAGRGQLAGAAAPPADDARTYMVDLLVRMAMPVLQAMAKGQLQQTFPVELSPIWRGADSRLCYL